MKKKVITKAACLLLALVLAVGAAPAAFAEDGLELSATYGDTLADVELPEGYEWCYDSDDISVGDAGESIFAVRHTVDGTITEENAVITVSPAYISEVSFKTDGSQYYIGNAPEPKVELFFRGEKLVKDIPPDGKKAAQLWITAVASVLILVAGVVSAYALDRKMNSPWVSDNTFNMDVYKVKVQNFVDSDGKPVNANCYKIPAKQLQMLANKKPWNIVCHN